MRVFPAGAIVVLLAALGCGGEDAAPLPPPEPPGGWDLGGLGDRCRPYPDDCDPGKQCVRSEEAWRCTSPPGVRTRNESCATLGEAAERCEPNHLCAGPAAEARCLRLCRVDSNCPTDAPRCRLSGDVWLCFP